MHSLVFNQKTAVPTGWSILPILQKMLYLPIHIRSCRIFFLASLFRSSSAACKTFAKNSHWRAPICSAKVVKSVHTYVHTYESPTAYAPQCPDIEGLLLTAAATDDLWSSSSSSASDRHRREAPVERLGLSAGP
jgi:hypothetical protein